MTFVEAYVRNLSQAVAAALVSPAVFEESPVRAATREMPQVVSVLPGGEVVDGTPVPRATRVREIHIVVHTAGDDHLALVESVLEVVHPLVMSFSMEGMVQVDEHSTDEPKYKNGDLRRQVVTKRYRVTYQTEADSLS